MGVAVSGEHFKHTATKLKDGDIERTAAEVEHGNLHILVCLVDTVGKGCSSGFVHDTLHVEAGNLTGFFRGLTLRVAEICRHGDNCFSHFLTEVVLGGLLHLLKNHGGDFLRRVLAAVHLYARCIVVAAYHFIRHACDFFLHLVVGFAHEALDRIDGALGVGDGLALGGVAHLTLAFVHKCHNGGRGALAFAVGDDNRFVAFKYGNTRVCSS